MVPIKNIIGVAMERLQGRVALVTGASAGIGAALCSELCRQGMRVVGCARNAQKIREIAEEETKHGSPGSIYTIKCDLTQESDILSMFDEIRRTFGRLDICINNAGLSHDASLLDGATSEWKNMIDVNVLALCICTREAVKLMKEAKVDDGQIIHISSMSGHRIPEMTSFMYVGTKFMVRALTEGLRRELKADGSRIRVASISPGLVETEFEYRCFKNDPETAKSIYTTIKCLEPEDIVQSVLYILAAPPRVEVHDILLRPLEQKV
ncbi:dehydrogenase/reductase SDR family member 11-like isoform X1 [Argiope bruennichi]|uniref:dehydrogenase/reductase SDR family member 11-like isoform X1 n=2 Tax=Argiope bruennichi TaxID=94029 RepID=UPI00249476C6|nr:dehydrogenase/reductase SDR family member 11-like isoform X1 [Argiope bruennichi]